MSKLIDQLEMELRAVVPMDSPGVTFDLARKIASSTTIGVLSLSEATNTHLGLHFTVLKGTQRQSGFDVWVSKEIEAEDGSPTGTMSVNIEWDDDVLELVGDLGDAARDSGVLKQIWRLWRAGRRGVPGFELYQLFVNRMAAELAELHPSAEITTLRPVGGER